MICLRKPSFFLQGLNLQQIICRCGSHDHNLYALDYKNHCCVYMVPCGGSIYGSPAIDEVYFGIQSLINSFSFATQDMLN
jgi:hypothetical protein